MSVEVLLLVVIAGLTLLGYMVAINAHGPTRLGISYLLATLMLAGTVWVVVQYMNAGQDVRHRQQLERLSREKQRAEQRLAQQQNAAEDQKERAAMAAKLSGIITEGTTLAARIRSADLQDRSVDYDGLVGRAIVAIRKADETKESFEKLPSPQSEFPEVAGTIEEALKQLKDASHYYRSYYSSEDSDQEELRERIMRQKARSAADLFRKATSQLAAAK